MIYFFQEKKGKNCIIVIDSAIVLEDNKEPKPVTLVIEKKNHFSPTLKGYSFL